MKIDPLEKALATVIVIAASILFLARLGDL